MRLGVALCALFGVVPSLPVRADPVRYGLRAEVAAEYDSNPGRVEVIDGEPTGRSNEVVGSPVGRLALSGELATPVGTRQSVSLFASVAGKRFVREEARPEDVVVAEASGAWNVLAAARTSLGLAGAYAEAFQRRGVEARDYRSSAPALRLEQGLGDGGVLSAGVGYRWLTYKPDAELDFQGPSAFAGYRQLFPGETGTADWEWSGGATAELRNFTGNRCLENACPGPLTAGARRDQFWALSGEVTRTGAFLAGAGLAVHGNLSNSFGERLLRGLVHVRAVVLLPAELSLSARAELVLARYLDGLPLVRNVMNGNPDVNLEGESRSTIRAELVRSLARHLDAGLRYTLYTNELGATPVHYFRQTAMLFIAVLAD
jgi:hypothetical protein